VDHRIATLSEAVVESIEHIERIFTKARAINVTYRIKVRAAERGIARRAPFHKGKNSIGDAILIETFAEAVASRNPDVRLAFVTHITRDFSAEISDAREPHPDFADIFSNEAVIYSTTLAQILNELQPDLLEEVRFKLEHQFAPRRMSEILAAERELELKVWYNRHVVRREAIEDGRTPLFRETSGRKLRRRPASLWTRFGPGRWLPRSASRKSLVMNSVHGTTSSGIW
jgi:hypothetical protein